MSTELNSTVSDYNELLDDYNQLERNFHTNPSTHVGITRVSDQEKTLPISESMTEHSSTSTEPRTSFTKLALSHSEAVNVSTNTELSYVYLENIDYASDMQNKQQEIMRRDIYLLL